MNIDYSIHGWLGLRVVHPSPGSARFVAYQLDPVIPTTLLADPDVSLVPVSNQCFPRIAYRLGNAGDHEECEFGESDFWLSNGGRMLCIPFESIGQCCEVRYDARATLRPAFRYARQILQLSLLNKGAIAIHSAAVVHEGKGILLAGWAESGKTELMLAFVDGGASFVSDKWTILKEDGSAMYNFPTPITVRPWVLRHLPGLAENLAASERWRLRMGPFAAAIVKKALESGRVGLEAGLRSFIAAGVDSVIRVSVPPSRLVRHATDAGNAEAVSLSAPFDKLFVLMTHDSRQISVLPADPSDVARRLVDCAQYERRGLLGLYAKFRYAFPSRSNSLLEEVRQRELTILDTALRSKEVFVVELPFPFDLRSAYDAVRAFC